ncbi:exodeoxyribonuclease VII small subunit, partial [Salmonella enterica subsp. enterica serovar Cerro]|nr:exodeoxyribonuclease VII small subunit [Salmonella enterica subsp. enterica serovar Cerro]
MPKKNEAPASFETALSELEHIVTRLESGDLPLEDAL